MTAHSSGAGTSWNETLDVDQPHGLDFQEWQDVRIGTRKRMSQEHASFAGATAGGIHKPGGSAVLGIDDDTATITADGTYRGHGLVWDGSVNLYCWTQTAGITDTPGVAGTEDWTILKMHPDKQWGGQDVTWQGAHEFDASVDISGNVTIEGDLTIEGSLLVDTDFSLTGDMAIDGTANFADDVAYAADISVDGTTVVQDTVLTGDSTFTFDAIAGETGPTVKMFGDWSARVIDTTQVAARTDGVVTAFISKNATARLDIFGQTPAGTTRIYSRSISDTNLNRLVSVTFPVKSGDTWAVLGDPTTHGAADVFWLPYGDNT